MRTLYVMTIIITILLGLASRKYESILPLFVAQNAGDVLWAMMVYFGMRFLFVQKNRITALTLGLVFCYSIEFSQLYQADWINSLRHTTLGRLILGYGFLAVDLLRYAIGMLLAFLSDLLLRSFYKL